MSFDWNVFWETLTSSTFLHGALISIVLAAISMIAASLLGLLIALGRGSSRTPVRAASWTYVWILRAIPTLLILLFVWNALPQLIHGLKAEWFTPFIAGFAALALNEAAYMAEITRAGLLSVDPGQRLAARALGMTPGKTLWKIVIPQAIRVAIPPTANEFITLLKLTSLASVISLRELLTVASQQVAVNFTFAETYAAAAIYYLVIVSALMYGQSLLEKRYRWSSRQASNGRLRLRKRDADEPQQPSAPAAVSASFHDRV